MQSDFATPTSRAFLLYYNNSRIFRLPGARLSGSRTPLKDLLFLGWRKNFLLLRYPNDLLFGSYSSLFCASSRISWVHSEAYMYWSDGRNGFQSVRRLARANACTGMTVYLLCHSMARPWDPGLCRYQFVGKIIDLAARPANKFAGYQGDDASLRRRPSLIQILLQKNLV
jgi:hypothetical protein